MNRQIRIRAGDVELLGGLYQNEMADNIWSSLPLEGKVRTWGDEIYFPAGVEEGAGEKRAEVKVGELGYWDQGGAFCLFFGPTPSSRGSEPRAASPVVVFGKVKEGLEDLKNLSGGEEIRVERAD